MSDTETKDTAAIAAAATETAKAVETGATIEARQVETDIHAKVQAAADQATAEARHEEAAALHGIRAILEHLKEKLAAIDHDAVAFLKKVL